MLEHENELILDGRPGGSDGRLTLRRSSLAIAPANRRRRRGRERAADREFETAIGIRKQVSPPRRVSQL